MTRRFQLLWKLLFVFFVACTLAGLGAWFTLLSTICSNPRAPMPETQHVIAYNCHGMTVFITPLANAMLHWLIPVEGLSIFLSVLATAMVVLAAAKVRVDVQFHHADASSGSPHREGGRDQLYLYVSFVPPGEAPEWVREKWVGLKLPLAQSTADSRIVMAGGVLTAPRSFFARLVALFTGRFHPAEGYVVDATAALSVLEAAHPEAAAWWKEHTPHMFRAGRTFVFAKGVGNVVQ
jgi:hypothetical protein